MKLFLAILLLVLLMGGCASTPGKNASRKTPQVTYGGTIETTITSGHGM